MNKTHTKSLGDVLWGLVDRHDLRTRIDEQTAVLHWSSAVGNQISSVTRPVGIKRGVLVVEVKSSSWRQELTYKKAEIAEKINSHLGATVVRNIVFK